METVPSFWVWYYKQGLKKLFNIYQSLILLTYDFFSINELLRTLFTPWKRDEVAPVTPSLQLILQAFWFNLIARLIGAVVRLVVIFSGLLTTALVGGLGLTSLVVLAFLPILAPVLVVVGIVLITNANPARNYGITFILLSIGYIILAFRTYQRDRLSDSPPSQPLSEAINQGKNLIQWLTKKANLLIGATTNPDQIKTKLVASQAGQFILSKAGIDSAEILQTSGTLDYQKILVAGARAALAQNHTRIEIADLVVGLISTEANLMAIIHQHQLDENDLINLAHWYQRLVSLSHPKSRLLSPAKLRFTGGIGKNWASGYTNFLYRFATDLTQTVALPSYNHLFIAHTEAVDEIERVLARQGKHNVILVGDSGVGKKTIVLGFARRVLLGATLAPLTHKRVLELNVGALLASASDHNPLENILISVLDEAIRAGNIILFIDEIERLLGGESGTIGAVNAVAILLPYLESDQLQLISTSSSVAYHIAVDRSPSLISAFEKIAVGEPSSSDTLKILQEITPFIENKYHLSVSYLALKEIVKQAGRYLPDRQFPEKGIELLDEVAVGLVSHGGTEIAPADIDQILSQKTKTPVGETEGQEKENLLNLENILHQRVVNQAPAISAIANALRRSRTGVSAPNRPVGSFLFLGPTGVGKTETAKALAQILFGDEKAMIRLDMSEFQETSSIHRLIGDESKGSGGMLTDQVHDHPYSVVLLDEIEKAKSNILDLFLQIIDEGRLTSALGQLTDFSHTIIIATSNAGANFIRQKVKLGGANLNMATLSKELIEMIQNENIFKPEFINRFDAVVAFRPLNIDELKQVVIRRMAILNQRLDEKKVIVNLTPGAIEKLATLGFDPEFGARALARTMTEKLEDLIAKEILSGKIQSGQTYQINEEMI